MDELKVLKTTELISGINLPVTKDEKTCEYLTKLKPALIEEYESFIEHLNFGMGCCRNNRWADSYDYYGIAVSERDRILNAFNNIEIPSGSDLFTYIHKDLNDKLNKYAVSCGQSISSSLGLFSCLGGCESTCLIEEPKESRKE